MRSLIPILLILLLLVGGWFLFGSDRGPDHGPEQDGAEAKPPTASTIASPTTPDAPAAATPPTYDRGLARSASSLEVLPTPEFDGAGLTIQVMQYGTDLPVMDALVLIGAEDYRPLPLDDLESRLLESGLVFHCSPCRNSARK